MEARIRDIEAKLGERADHRRHGVNAAAKSCSARRSISWTSGDGSEAQYQIVGEDEADIKSGLLSIGSPIARALIGKQEGDEVEVVDAERQARLRDRGRRVPLVGRTRIRFRCHAAPVRANRWRQRQERDIYVEQATRDGWRSRAVFKLEQIQAKERLLRSPASSASTSARHPAAGASWRRRLVGPNGRVVAIDLLRDGADPGRRVPARRLHGARDARRRCGARRGRERSIL